MDRRVRLVIVVASVIAAIAGSILLAMRRSGEAAATRGEATRVPSDPDLAAAVLPAGGTVVARIRIGRSVQPPMGGGALAVGEGAVWAMSDAKEMLMRIDPATNAVVARIDVPPPEAIAAGDGAVWLSYPAEDKVVRIDPATNAVAATIPVPWPEGIATSPGAVWVATAGAPSLSRIDPATNRVVAAVPVGPKRACCAEHMSVIASSRAVWVAVTNGNTIVRVDPATNTVAATARTDYPPCGFLAADRTGVWSTSACGGDVVARIDSRTNQVTTKVGGVHPVGLGIAFGSVWVVVVGSGNVDRLDPVTGRLVARLHVVGLPVRLGAGFGSIWVNDDFGRVLRIKPQR